MPGTRLVTLLLLIALAAPKAASSVSVPSTVEAGAILAVDSWNQDGVAALGFPSAEDSEESERDLRPGQRGGPFSLVSQPPFTPTPLIGPRCGTWLTRLRAGPGCSAIPPPGASLLTGPPSSEIFGSPEGDFEGPA